MKCVLHYETDPKGMDLARQHFPAHRARLDAFHARGELLMVGMFDDPREGALGIYRDREAAERFVQGDPFILHGVVQRWTLKDWNEIYGV